jgi:hypothetical protein
VSDFSLAEGDAAKVEALCVDRSFGTARCREQDKRAWEECGELAHCRSRSANSISAATVTEQAATAMSPEISGFRSATGVAVALSAGSESGV